MAIKFNLPTTLTLLRIAMIPLLAVVFYLPWEHANLAALAIFITAGITDWLDGYLARKMKLETAFGAFLDPAADKVMVAFVLVLIVQAQDSAILAVAAAIIIAREIIVASLREWMAEIGQRATVKVSQLGKWKTSTQMVAIGFLLYRDDLIGFPISLIGVYLLYIAAILTLWTMLIYLATAHSVLNEK